MEQILTSYHLKGREEGREEGVIALQNTLVKLSRQKLGSISPEVEQRIQEINDIVLLEKALEHILNLENEQELLQIFNGAN